MNGSASSGFDVIAAPFIKGAVVLRPKINGQEVQRVSMFLSPLWLSFSSCSMTRHASLLVESMQN
eukprot:543127-Pelagomonas_calceolata.AAC.1